jgi:hypothetical protein
MGKNWIVLINKSPKGPLTLEEVTTLIQEKIISRTDLALLVSDTQDEGKQSWKFLWQYPEFDLRVKTNPNVVPPGGDLRKARSSQEIKSHISEVLPDEIAMINPEDLIVTAQKVRRMEPKSVIEKDPGQTEEFFSYAPSRPGNVRWAYALVFTGVVVVGLAMKNWLSSFTEMGSNPRGLAQEPVSLENSTSTETSKGRKLNLSPNPSAPQLAAKEPVIPPAKNEISLEEYQRLKDEKLEQERKEEEDKRREMEESEKMVGANSEDAESESEVNDEARESPPKRRNAHRSIGSKRVKKRPTAEEGEEVSEVSQESAPNESTEDGNATN